MTTRSPKIAAVLAFVAALLAALYAAAPTLSAIAAKHYLKGIIEVSELEIESVGDHRQPPPRG